MITAVGVGDYVIDRYYHCDRMFPGGNALNFAVYSKQLGHESAFVSVLADDRYTDIVKDALETCQIDYSMCVQRHGETWLCNTRLENGERTITDANDCGVIKNQPLVIDSELIEYLSNFDIIHTNVNGWLGEQIFQLKKTHVPIIYDYSDLWESLDDLLAIVPGIDFAFLSGKGLPKEQLRDILKKLVEEGCELAICTIGKKGAIVYDGEQFYTEEPYNLHADVVDTLGAGDSFLTGFITTYIEGKKRFYELTQGEHGKYCTPNDMKKYLSQLVQHAMQVGNLIAIRNCMVLGAFDLGTTLEEY